MLVLSCDREEEIPALLEEAYALARRRGDRFWEIQVLDGLCEDARLNAADLVPGPAIAEHVCDAATYTSLTHDHVACSISPQESRR